jgi:hypothetical protein
MDKNMTAEEFLITIMKNRTLTTHGFGVRDGSKDTLEDERGNLVGCYNEALVCEAYLKTRTRTEQPNQAAGSTKEIAREVNRQCRSRRIREGALILAAINLGFKMEQVRNQTSVYLNIE